MSGYRTGVLAGIIGFLGVALWTVPAEIIGGWASGPMPMWVPTFGPLTATLRFYFTMVDILAPLLTIGLAIGLGYYGSRSFEFHDEHRRFGYLIAAGSTIGVIIGWGLLIFVNMGYTIAMTGILAPILIAGSVIQILVLVALPVTVGAYAGAAGWSVRQGDTRDDAQPETAPQRIQY